MGKFCGKCGSELKNNKCPKCDKKETKKVVKKEEVKVESNEGNVFGWGVLGFFVPIVGLILFLTWKNNRKRAAKAAGIGALIGFVKNLIIIIISWIIVAISIIPYNIKYNGNYNGYYPPIEWDEDIDEDEDEDEHDIDTIYINNINTDKPLSKKEFKSVDTVSILEDKEYVLDNKDLKVLLKKNKNFTITTSDGVTLVDLKDIAYAEHTESDCSGWDLIYAVGLNKQYYIDLNKHVVSDIKAVETHRYSGYSAVINHSYTCGGSHLLLGIDSQGNYYDLNGETEIELENLYYYDDGNNWIGYRTRGYKLAGVYGNAKGVISGSPSDVLMGIIDVTGIAYLYTYDNGKSSLTQIVNDEISLNNLVVKVEYDNDDETTTLVFDNGATYTIEYSVFDY